LYAPSELLEQVEQQVRSEFKEQITYFEWWNEEEYTTILVSIRSVALQITVKDRIRQIVNTIIGHPDACEYIVPISVSAIESVDATDGLFNLTYHGAGSNSFFVHYYAPERSGSNPFKVSIYYRKMFDAVRTIQLDSPAQLWERLVRPIREVYAKQEGISSFSKDLLASDLRDFLLEHLDFIQHIAEAISFPVGAKKPLQILEPAAVKSPLPQPTNLPRRRASYLHKAREVALPVAAAA
jgi:hypothetical protein